jgi:DNA-binding transcriptional LysR family regulator
MTAIRLEWLVSLDAISKNGSFSRAADALGITQSAISQRIGALEHAVGRPLIIKDKPLTLTPSGMLVLRYAKRYTQLSQSINSELRTAIYNRSKVKLL